jgi:hypothetical protein
MSATPVKLLLDSTFTEAQVLTEDVADGAPKRMYITGPFLMFDKPNRNKRMYPGKVMESAVQKYIKEYVNERRALGEMNHPAGRLQVDPERACILTESLERDGNYYMGKAKVLSTPLGKTLQCLLEDGVKIGVSSRGVGTLQKRGELNEVKSDFNLTVAADIVFDPSVGDAFVSALMEEREFIFVDGAYVEKDIFEAKARIKVAPAAQLEEKMLAEWQTFLNKISAK